MKQVLLLCIGLVLALTACTPKDKLSFVTGETMGTTYTVSIVGTVHKREKAKIDSLLSGINRSVSTYDPNSVISLINQAKANTNVLVDEHFLKNYSISKSIYQDTQGKFNPAVMPLVNYWGFGYERLRNNEGIDTVEVQRLQQLSEFKNFELSEIENKFYISKSNDDSKLDFSAIAKGYGVDALAEFLLKHGHSNFVVEIGGETYAQGIHPENRPWNIGIRKPAIDSRKETEVMISIPINGRALATSGNYENYRQIGVGQIIAHTIDPDTGFPQSLNQELLSASVLADDCITADAYATAFQVMGLVDGLALAERNPRLEAMFIYVDSDGQLKNVSTSGFEK